MSDRPEPNGELPPQEDLSDLRDLADSILERLTADMLMVQSTESPWNSELWNALSESGLTMLTTPTAAGGSGAGLAEAAVVLEACGRHAAGSMLVENDLLAAWMLTSAGMDVPIGPLTSTTSAVELDSAAGKTLVRGSVERVPWARYCDEIVVLATGPQDLLLRVPRGQAQITPGLNVGYEPRDTVSFEMALDDVSAAEVGVGVAEEWLRRGALGRAHLISGALARALELTISHAVDRRQFGRSLAKFQAVQHMIAMAAGEVAATRAACDTAVLAAVQSGLGSDRAEFTIGAAKVQSVRAARTVTSVAHQVHGAIGFTLDHQLRHFTMRATAYGAEFGNEAFWNRRLGALVATEPGGLWSALTALD